MIEKRNIYKGQRYVPKVTGLWNNLLEYEGLSIVTWEGTSYTSKKRVPAGIDITNEEYWVVTGNYNAQVEGYRQEVRDYKDNIENVEKNTVVVSTEEPLVSELWYEEIV